MTNYIVRTLQNSFALWPICERLLCLLHKFKMLSYGFASTQHLGFSTLLRSVKNPAKWLWSFFRLLTILYKLCHDRHQISFKCNQAAGLASTQQKEDFSTSVENVYYLSMNEQAPISQSIPHRNLLHLMMVYVRTCEV